MTATDTVLRRITVPLPGNRVLQLALLDDDLILVAGFESDPPLQLLASGVNLPASALPALRDALGEMSEHATQEAMSR